MKIDHTDTEPAVETDEPEIRRASRRTPYDIHERLRAQIVEGKIAAGAILSQAQVARQLGVSRTPVREAMRMLQNEGLIIAEPNNRARVRGFSADELEAVYSNRILLESLAVAISVPRLTQDDFDDLDATLIRMSAEDCRSDFDTWVAEHRNFHLTMSCRCGDSLLDRIGKLAEESTRFQYMVNSALKSSWLSGRDVAHVELLAACKSRNASWASRLMAQHLSQTALSLLNVLALEPGVHGNGILTALKLATGGSDALTPTFAAEVVNG